MFFFLPNLTAPRNEKGSCGENPHDDYGLFWFASRHLFVSRNPAEIHTGKTMASSDTGGVKPMSITGRMVRERERLLGMSPEERAWRAQWLKDQHLSPNEPKYVPEYWKERYNPIRRAYRAPLNMVQNVLTPVIVGFLRDHRSPAGRCYVMIILKPRFSSFFSRRVSSGHMRSVSGRARWQSPRLPFCPLPTTLSTTRM